MAVGDNLPDIFGGLAQSVMKADGPMYLMDLFEGRDADREMNLRQEASMGGPPMPMMLPIGKPPTKLLKKKLKKKKKLSAKGPLEAALGSFG